MPNPAYRRPLSPGDHPPSPPDAHQPPVTVPSGREGGLQHRRPLRPPRRTPRPRSRTPPGQQPWRRHWPGRAARRGQPPDHAHAVLRQTQAPGDPATADRPVRPDAADPVAAARPHRGRLAVARWVTHVLSLVASHHEHIREHSNVRHLPDFQYHARCLLPRCPVAMSRDGAPPRPVTCSGAELSLYLG